MHGGLRGGSLGMAKLRDGRVAEPASADAPAGIRAARQGRSATVYPDGARMLPRGAGERRYQRSIHRDMRFAMRRIFGPYGG
jgi:hypothetical protein